MSSPETDILFDPHTLAPWRFPKPGVDYVGRILTTPYVVWRLDANGNPQLTTEGAYRWSLWMCVDTAEGLRGFCIETNPLAQAFNGNATEANLRRWEHDWNVGGRLQLSWTRDGRDRHLYRGRYSPPPATPLAER